MELKKKLKGLKVLQIANAIPLNMYNPIYFTYAIIRSKEINGHFKSAHILLSVSFLHVAQYDNMNHPLSWSRYTSPLSYPSTFCIPSSSKSIFNAILTNYPNITDYFNQMQIFLIIMIKLQAF